MSVTKDFGLGFRSVTGAFSFIHKKSLYKYFIIPGIISLVILVLIILLAGATSSFVYGQLTSLFDPGSFGRIIGVLIYIGVLFSFGLIYIIITRYLVLMIMAPVFAYLSEKVEYLHTGKEQPVFEMGQFLADIWRGIVLALKNLLWEALFFVLFLLLSFIPVINLLALLAGLVVTAYFAGHSLIDYTLERKKMNVKDSNKFVLKHKGFAVAVGLYYNFLLLVPLAGILIAPASSEVAATLGTLELLEQDIDAVDQTQG